MDVPLPVALGYIEDENRFLVVKRTSNNYRELYGFPGGKVETDEHIKDALIREVEEEAGVESKVTRHLGTVSESIRDGDETSLTIIHFFELELLGELEESGEMISRWVGRESLEDQGLIPSGRRMVEEIIIRNRTGYYESEVVLQNGEYVQKRFEKVLR